VHSISRLRVAIPRGPGIRPSLAGTAEEASEESSAADTERS
jgi:hypothetical protein